MNLDNGSVRIVPVCQYFVEQAQQRRAEKVSHRSCERDDSLVWFHFHFPRHMRHVNGQIGLEYEQEHGERQVERGEGQGQLDGTVPLDNVQDHQVNELARQDNVQQMGPTCSRHFLAVFCGHADLG